MENAFQQGDNEKFKQNKTLEDDSKIKRYHRDISPWKLKLATFFVFFSQGVSV